MYYADCTGNQVSTVTTIFLKQQEAKKETSSCLKKTKVEKSNYAVTKHSK